MNKCLIALPLMLMLNAAFSADKTGTQVPAAPTAPTTVPAAKPVTPAAAKVAPVGTPAPAASPATVAKPTAPAVPAAKAAPVSTPVAPTPPVKAAVVEATPTPPESVMAPPKKKKAKHYRKPAHLPKGDLRHCLDQQGTEAIIRCTETGK
jgi:hypothetical protein